MKILHVLPKLRTFCNFVITQIFWIFNCFQSQVAKWPKSFDWSIWCKIPPWHNSISTRNKTKIKSIWRVGGNSMWLWTLSYFDLERISTLWRGWIFEANFCKRVLELKSISKQCSQWTQKRKVRQWIWNYIQCLIYRKTPKAAIGFSYGDTETVPGSSKQSDSEESDEDIEDQQEYGIQFMCFIFKAVIFRFEFWCSHIERWTRRWFDSFGREIRPIARWIYWAVKNWSETTKRIWPNQRDRQSEIVTICL